MNRDGQQPRVEPGVQQAAAFLALRPDLGTGPVLEKLLTVASSTTPAVARTDLPELLARSLGREKRDRIAWVDEGSFTSSLVTSTHRARLDDTEVAVRVALDDAGLRARARELARHVRSTCRALEIPAPDDLESEVDAWLRQDADLERELRDLELLFGKARLHGSSEMSFPRPFPELSGPRILTFEHLPVSPWIDGRPPVRELVRSFLEQGFAWGCFSCRVAPSDLNLAPDGRLVAHRFGPLVVLDEAERRRQLELLAAVYRGDLGGTSRALARILVPGETTDVEAFRRHWLAAARNYAAAGGGAAADAADDTGLSPPSLWLLGLLRVSREHDMWLPRKARDLYRAVVVIEALARRATSTGEAQEMLRGALTKKEEDDLLDHLTPGHLRSTLTRLAVLAQDGPANVHQLLTQMADGTLHLHSQVHESRRTHQTRVRSARMVTAALLCVAIAELLGHPDLPRIFGISLAWPLALSLGAAAGFVVVQWRRLR